MLGSFFAQPLSKSFLVYLLVWNLHFILHTFRNTCPYHRNPLSECHLFLVPLFAFTCNYYLLPHTNKTCINYSTQSDVLFFVTCDFKWFKLLITATKIVIISWQSCMHKLQNYCSIIFIGYGGNMHTPSQLQLCQLFSKHSAATMNIHQSCKLQNQWQHLTDHYQSTDWVNA